MYGITLKNKIKFLERKGFKKKYANKKLVGYDYKSHIWYLEKIDTTPLSVIVKYKDCYDGKITETELKSYIKMRNDMRINITFKDIKKLKNMIKSI